MVLGRVKTKLEKSGEIIAYSEGAVRNNVAIVEYCRTSMAALSGGTAGLLGLTGFYGFGFYMFAVLGLWVLLMIKAGPQWRKYFINRRTILTAGFFGGLFTYVLFWTSLREFYKHVLTRGFATQGKIRKIIRGKKSKMARNKKVEKGRKKKQCRWKNRRKDLGKKLKEGGRKMNRTIRPHIKTDQRSSLCTPKERRKKGKLRK